MREAPSPSRPGRPTRPTQPVRPTPDRGRPGRRRVLLWGAVAAVVVAGGATVAAVAATGDGAVVARCGDLTIDTDGVMVHAQGLAGQVGAAFAREHAIDSYGADFWGETYDGASPLDALADAVVDQLALDCATWTLADELGAQDPAGSREILADATGSADATDYELLRSAVENLRDGMRTELLESDPPSEDELRAAFDGLDDVYKGTHVALTLWRVDAFAGTADELADLARTAISPAPDLAVMAAGVDGASPGATVTELALDSQEVSKEDLFAAHVIELAGRAEPGDVVPGMTDGEYVVVLDRAGGELLTLEQAPQMARNAYVNDLLEQRIADVAAAEPLSVERDLRPILERELTAPR